MASPSEAQVSTSYRHPLAYRLLIYRAWENTTRYEAVWNSRDGMVPEQIEFRDGTLARIAHLQEQPAVPEHRPLVGERIFVAMTPAHAREIASERAGEFWREGGAYGRAAQLHFRSELEVTSWLFDNLLMDILDGASHLVTVTQEMAVANGWV